MTGFVVSHGRAVEIRVEVSLTQSKLCASETKSTLGRTQNNSINAVAFFPSTTNGVLMCFREMFVIEEEIQRNEKT